MSRIFISYRRADTEGYVGRLYDHLTQHFSRDDIFMDVDVIKPGQDFVSEIENAVASCEVCIVVIGKSWLSIADEKGVRRLDNWNDFVRLEIATALKMNKLVIPVLVERAKMPQPNQLPDDMTDLARRNAIEISHERFQYDVHRLIEAVQQVIAQQVPQTAMLQPATSIQRLLGDPKKIGEKYQKLKAMREQVINLTESPLYEYRAQHNHFPVLGEGNPDARILFVGESPGSYEVKQGRPFCGPSGDVLEEMLDSIGLTRNDVYVTNIVKDHPPGSRDPTREEIAHYAPFLNREIQIIQPEVIAPLGRFAMEYILRKFELTEKQQKISELHGKLLAAQADYGVIRIVPLYHPAVVLYRPSDKSILQQDFKKLSYFV